MASYLLGSSIYVEPVPPPTQMSLPIPYYDDGNGIVIYHADSNDVLPYLDNIGLVLTDPPYGIGFDTNYTRFTTGFRVPRTTHKPVHGDDKPFDPTPLLKFKRVILWGANCYSSSLPRGAWLVWDKRFPNGSAFLADAEVAWMNKGYGVYLYAETSQGCIRSEKIEHPTQKPVNLMRWCIDKSKTDGLVVDPYMGSGTTLRAAKDLGRKCIGIDIEEKYCEIAAKRLAQEVLPL